MIWIKGRITPRGKFWAVEIPLLGAFTQGRSMKEAYAMAADWVETMAEEGGTPLKAQIAPVGEREFLISSADVKSFIAFVLRRHRVVHRLTLADVAKRLGAASPNAYARYEQGAREPTVSKFMELLSAVSDAPAPVVFSTPAGVRRAPHRRKAPGQKRRAVKQITLK